jgi:hypothetical protein
MAGQQCGAASALLVIGDRRALADGPKLAAVGNEATASRARGPSGPQQVHASRRESSTRPREGLIDKAPSASRSRSAGTAQRRNRARMGKVNPKVRPHVLPSSNPGPDDPGHGRYGRPPGSANPSPPGPPLQRQLEALRHLGPLALHLPNPCENKSDRVTVHYGVRVAPGSANTRAHTAPQSVRSMPLHHATSAAAVETERSSFGHYGARLAASSISGTEPSPGAPVPGPMADSSLRRQ